MVLFVALWCVKAKQCPSKASESWHPQSTAQAQRCAGVEGGAAPPGNGSWGSQQPTALGWANMWHIVTSSWWYLVMWQSLSRLLEVRFWPRPLERLKDRQVWALGNSLLLYSHIFSVLVCVSGLQPKLLHRVRHTEMSLGGRKGTSRNGTSEMKPGNKAQKHLRNWRHIQMNQDQAFIIPTILEANRWSKVVHQGLFQGCSVGRSWCGWRHRCRVRWILWPKA